MIHEVTGTQVEHEPYRRWFFDEDFDLIVWLSDHATVMALELCYDKPGFERAVTWSRDQGYAHFRVDSGEESPMRNRTPILVSDGAFPKADVIARFTRASIALDPAIRGFVLERLRQFPS